MLYRKIKFLIHKRSSTTIWQYVTISACSFSLVSFIATDKRFLAMNTLITAIIEGVKNITDKTIFTHFINYDFQVQHKEYPTA